MGIKRLRILFVVRPSNVHSARWINQLADEGWDLHVFPTHDGPWHPDFRNVTLYDFDRSHGYQPNPRARSRVLWPLPFASDRLRMMATHLPDRWASRAACLAWLIRWLKPDLVHSLEFQQAGYLTLQSKSFYKGQFPTWAVNNWGSDIDLYGPLQDHRERVRGILANCDYYACECQRDIALAQEYGFKGKAWPVLPMAGGFPLETIREFRQPGATSARRVITLKGYQHWAGRSLFGLRAIELCAETIKAGGFRVAIYLADADMRLAAERISLRTGIPVEIVPGAHLDMLRLHGRSRVSIGLSISDGLSTSALEAMLMGSFPIQSDTSCLTELGKDGESVLMVPPEDPSAIAAAIKRAISDDALVDRASELNAQICAEHLDYQKIRTEVVAMYRRIALPNGDL